MVGKGSKFFGVVKFIYFCVFRDCTQYNVTVGKMTNAILTHLCDGFFIFSTFLYFISFFNTFP